MYSNILSALKSKLRATKFETLQKYGFANMGVNSRVYPVSVDSLASSVSVNRVDLSMSEIQRLAAFGFSIKLNYKDYPHTKLLEYLTSIKLLELEDGDVVLDAAGGGSAEFPRYAAAYTNKDLRFICQDARPIGDQSTCGINVDFVSGSIDNVPLGDGSLNAISCHHSFEHFNGDLDVRFIKECLRLLAPGGKLVIVPFFVSNIYAEIWNKKPVATRDRGAEVIYDWTASFPGWGPYEGFARTYSSKMAKERIFSVIPSGQFEAEVYSVLLDGRACPDMNYASYQPLVNSDMKALRIARK